MKQSGSATHQDAERRSCQRKTKLALYDNSKQPSKHRKTVLSSKWGQAFHGLPPLFSSLRYAWQSPKATDSAYKKRLDNTRQQREQTLRSIAEAYVPLQRATFSTVEPRYASLYRAVLFIAFTRFRNLF